MKRNLCVGPGTRGISLLLAALLMGGGSMGLWAAPPGGAPLDGGYAMAPEASAPAEEKAAASREARLKVLGAAEKYKNTPYRHGGVDETGMDCSGLIYVSFRDSLGVSLPRSTIGLYSWAEKIPDGDLQPGDLVFFKTDHTGRVSHAGIYAGGGRFIHSASQGPATGVMYSRLDEDYWARAYAGAGRALPEADITDAAQQAPVWTAAAPAAPAATPASSGGRAGAGKSTAAPAAATTAAPASPTATAAAGTSRPAVSPAANDAWVSARPGGGVSGAVGDETNKSQLLLAVGVAPSWNGYLEGGNSLVRGFAAQLHLGGEIKAFNLPLHLGVEVRPEYDGLMSVFHLPVTVSLGLDDRFRVFIGPAVSIGDAGISTPGQRRGYVGGTNIIGTIGVTAAPFSFDVGGGKLAPYAELAWQSYAANTSSPNLGADLAASLRFSTGIRFTMKVR